MTTRKYKRTKFRTLKTVLTNDAEYNSLSDTYGTKIAINQNEYMLKIQFADGDRIIVWNAIETNRSNKNSGQYTVITDDKVLEAILNILIWQRTVQI